MQSRTITLAVSVGGCHTFNSQYLRYYFMGFLRATQNPDLGVANRGSFSFRLKVNRVEGSCLFELSWGKGQQLSAVVAYPDALTIAYQQWRRAYLNFYHTMPSVQVEIDKTQEKLRGRVEETGNLTPPRLDWQAKLVQAEAVLLYQFHHWLKSADLFEIRSAIARSATAKRNNDRYRVDVFLACHPLELARLPWETWEINSEFAAAGQICFARCPTNVLSVKGEESFSPYKRVRVLAILGDETGLNFQTDREAIGLLGHSSTVEFVTWQPEQSAAEIKNKISLAIADERGWDILFFAGHSNETEMTGGELAIAPGVSLSIQEIAPQLTAAKKKGLRLAIFNSCSGLSLAEASIELGISQVVLMREPIHDRVAQEFLWYFLQAIAEGLDAHNALRQSCQQLKLTKNLTYPSAYLIPSLFRHPEAKLFRLEPRGIKILLQQWQPARREAIALTALLLLSMWPPLQDFLLEHRLWLQAVYRDLTAQVPSTGKVPPVLLVQIDPQSIARSTMAVQQPMDRAYLASLVERLAEKKAKIIGIDYLFDRQQPDKDPILARTVRKAVENRGSWFVFAAIKDSAAVEVGVNPATEIASPNWSLQAYVNALPTHLRLPKSETDCRRSCPFAYLLSLVAAYLQDADKVDRVKPKLDSRTQLRPQLLNKIEELKDSPNDATFLKRLHSNPIASWSGFIGQIWLRPILDFSISPDRVYQRISAWQLLENSEIIPDLDLQIALVAAGGYEEAGISQPDSFPVPKALQYWRMTLAPQSVKIDRSLSALEDLPVFTGAEAHAYAIYHLLNKHLVLPIPDVWMVLVAAFLGKASLSLLEQKKIEPKLRIYLTLYLFGTIGIYAIIGWQMYISSAILLPWLFPSGTFLIYILPILWRTERV
jgi:hypothetical protein